MKKSACYFLFFLVLLSLLNPLTSQAQFRRGNVTSDEKNSVQKIDDTVSGSDIKESKQFYVVPRGYWPKIQILNVYSALIVWISFIMGLAIFFIARYAGARVNKIRIWTAIFSAVLIGMLGRGVLIMGGNHLFRLLRPLLGEIVAATAVDVLTYFITLLYVAGVAVHLYEIFTVTSEEMFKVR